MNYTKGNWVADASRIRTSINVMDTPQKHIAMVNIGKYHEYEITLEEHESNANLLAAAPDLYEALILCTGYIHNEHIKPEDKTFIEKALKKARGDK
jgi:hypothetical protein